MAEYTEDLCKTGYASASGYIGGYPPASAFNDNATEFGWLDNIGLGDWLQYDFGFEKAKRIQKYTLSFAAGHSAGGSPNAWTLEGSNNDIDWTVLDSRSDITSMESARDTDIEFIFVNSNSYRYYRLDITINNGDPSYICVTEMNMMEAITFNFQPTSTLYNTKQTKMRGKAAEGFIRPTIAEFFTSKDFEEILNTPIGYTTTKCVGGDASASSAIQPASNAFDAGGNGWQANPGAASWLQYDFGAGNEYRIERYVLSTYWAANGYTSLLDWTLQGSSDGATWSDLDVQAGQWMSRPPMIEDTRAHVYNLKNSDSYRYYRLLITALRPDIGWPMVWKLEMMEGIYE